MITYSDGEVRQEVTYVYAVEIESCELKIDDESKEAAWVRLSSAVELRGLTDTNPSDRKGNSVTQIDSNRRWFLGRALGL